MLGLPGEEVGAVCLTREYRGTFSCVAQERPRECRVRAGWDSLSQTLPQAAYLPY